MPDFARITPDGIIVEPRTVTFEEAHDSRIEATRVRITELFDEGVEVRVIGDAVGLAASAIHVYLGELYLERGQHHKTMSVLGREYVRVTEANQRAREKKADEKKRRDARKAKRAAQPAAHPRPAPTPPVWPSRATPEPSEATRPNRQPAVVSAEYAAYVDDEPEVVTW